MASTRATRPDVDVYPVILALLTAIFASSERYNATFSPRRPRRKYYVLIFCALKTSSFDPAAFKTEIEGDGVVIVSLLDYNASSVVIPAQIDGRPVVKIGESAFENCILLTSVEIPASVETIGESAFRGCQSLTSVEIPASVETIGEGAFRACASLTSVEIPASVEKIGDNAFSDCASLTSVEIPDSVEEIGGNAFYGCASDLTLYGADGSVAQEYAVENELRFEAR